MSIVRTGLRKISMCRMSLCISGKLQSYCWKIQKRVNVIFNDKDMHLYNELLSQASANGITNAKKKQKE